MRLRHQRGADARRPSVYRTIVFLLPTVLLAALTQSGCALTSGNLAANQRTLNFGNVVVGSSSKQSLTFTNSGTSALTVTQAVATGKGFAVAGPTLPLLVPVGQSATFTTIFTPTQAGTASGSVSITSSTQTPGAPRPTGGSSPPTVTTQVETVAVSGAGVPVPSPLQFTSSSLPNAQVGVPFQASLAATGGVQPYHWAVTTGTLPSGLSLGPDTGVISGTTTQGGQSGFTVQVSDSSSPAPQTAMKALTLSVLAFALQINSGALHASGQVGVGYQGSLSGTGGVTPYTWSVTGALPAGLSLNISSGAVTGTPTQSGTSSFTITLTDAAQQTAQMPFSITIAAAGAQPPGGSSSCSGVPTVPPSSPPSGLSLSCSGTGINQAITIDSAGQFRLVFEAADNWGLSQWYDLVNDPNATTNLTLAWPVTGPSGGVCQKQNGLANMVFYGDNDRISDMFEVASGCPFSSSSSMTIIQSTPLRIVLQTAGLHPLGNTSTDTNVAVTVTYYIYWNGQIYIHNSVGVGTAQDLSAGGLADLFILDMGLNDPAQTGTTPPDSKVGWVRAVATQNPWAGNGTPENSVFAYWDPTTPTYGNFTKASIMAVASPNNPSANYYPILHSWGCGTGCGTVRWGYRIDHSSSSLYNLGAGQTISFDWMIQLGTQGSSVLPNITSSAVAGPIANAYRANPTPPSTGSGGTPPNPPPGQTSLTISPSAPPAVNQGATFKFMANIPVTWSLAPVSQGTIDSDGTYHAPATVNAKQSYGGYQALPNNHIFNTRIDSLPVNANSAAWVAGAGAVPVNYLQSFPVNYVDASTPTQNMVFFYTPGNNGPFKIPQYPYAEIESGWFSGPFGTDRHFFAIDTTNGTFQEMYNYYPAGAATSVEGCSGCTSQSGAKYSNSSYDLPAHGATDAAGLYVMPLSLHLQELVQAIATGGTINHALRFTLQNGYICGSSIANACGGNASGTRHIWPASSEALSGVGVVPYGARFRLKSSFDISKFSPIARILLTQLKQYGIILADGGGGWQITTDYTRWPANILASFREIGGAAIGPSNFEAVDESGLMVSASSGNTNVGGETVIATDASNPANSAQMAVVLTGVTINLPKDALYFQAGAAPLQLVAYVNGSSNTGVVWSMNPPVGTLTSGGVYTAPASQNAPATTTVTATSLANPSVAASMQLTVLPNGSIRVYSCTSSSYVLCSSTYTDSTGKIWYPMTGDDGGYPYDNGGSWPSIPDITLYKVPYYSQASGGQDLRFDIYVPNGSYSITAKESETNDCAAGNELTGFEAQGTLVFDKVDLFTAAGGCNLAKDFVLPASVTSGLLSFVVRRESTTYTHISALEIDLK